MNLAEELFFGNYSSNHIYWFKIQEEVKKAIENIKKLINATKDSFIIFTSWATESNNMIINSFATWNNHIISTEIEHKCILNALKNAKKEKNINYTLLWVDDLWFINNHDLKNNIRKETKLISVIYANNEIGVIQDIDSIWQIAKNNEIIFHSDASQALAKIKIDVQESKIDLLSGSAHKFYWPKWVWFLYIKNSEILKRLKPLIFWWWQQFWLRSWTLNNSWIIWIWEASYIANRDFEKNISHYVKLKDYLLEKLLKIEWVIINWPIESCKRLPNNINFYVENIKWPDLLRQIITKFAISSGSACNSNNSSVSHVLSAIWLNENQCSSSIRIWLWKDNTIEELDKFIVELKNILIQLKTGKC
jgi:cysteine desulfurase